MWLKWLLVGLLCLALGACDSPENDAATAASSGYEGSGYVVINSALAHIFVALGAADQIVATGPGVDYIEALDDTPRIPHFRQSSAESLLTFRPQTVVSISTTLEPDVAKLLRSAGVEVVIFPYDPSMAGVKQRIMKVAGLLGKAQQGTELVARFESEFADARAMVKRLVARSDQPKPRGLFILSGGGRPTLVAGRGTSPAALIEFAGGENVATGFEGFKIMSQEAMIEAAPTFILVNEDGLNVANGAPVALSAPGASRTPAARSGKLVTIPSEYLSGFGLQTPEAIRALARKIYPAAGASRPGDADQ